MPIQSKELADNIHWLLTMKMWLELALELARALGFEHELTQDAIGEFLSHTKR